MLLGLNFVIVHVPDVEKARAFYTEKLGLEVEGQQPDFVQFKQPMGQGAAFSLAKGNSPAVSTDEGTELWWFVDNADATYTRLAAQDVEVVTKPHDEPFGRALAIKDPYGNIVYLLQLPQHS